MLYKYRFICIKAVYVIIKVFSKKVILNEETIFYRKFNLTNINIENEKVC